mgnify:FL=1
MTDIKKVQIVKPGESMSSQDRTISIKAERFFDKHNHKMEFLRTFFGFITISLQLVILAKIFNLI